MSTSPTWLVANWKMNGDPVRVAAWVAAIEVALGRAPASVCTVFCPPFPYIATANAALAPAARIQLGAQNCHEAPNGAFTGEVSAPMLAQLGVTHVIVGHSERRAMGETDAEIVAKASAALAAGLTPVICVGESRAAYDAGETLKVLDVQLASLAALPTGYQIAYEPVWAIGSQHTPQMAEIESAHQHIKSVLGSASCVLYGGSVNPANIGQILGLPEVSGALIGGASLEIDSMCAMVAAASQLRGN